MRLKLSGDYRPDKQSSIAAAVGPRALEVQRVDVAVQRRSFVYSDNTTICAKENQSVTWVGVTYTYRLK